MQTYYKITNETECHNGYQYVDGLNILDKIFEQNGSCVKGGLYFTTIDHIIKFLHYGINLRVITLPEDCTYVIDNNDKYRADKIILGAKYSLTDPETWQLLVERGADILLNNNYAVQWASEYGFLAVVKFLVNKGADIRANNDYALRMASANGHLAIVKFLLKKGANIHASNDVPLQWASKYGYTVVVKYLLEKGANIHAGDDFALKLASREGHLETAQHLVENGANVCADDNCALKLALERGHMDVAKFLMLQC